MVAQLHLQNSWVITTMGELLEQAQLKLNSLQIYYNSNKQEFCILYSFVFISFTSYIDPLYT
jgi:hypothetical protein